MSSGNGILVGGQAIVYAPDIKFASEVALQYTDQYGVIGELGVAFILPGIAFTVVSTSILDNSHFSWTISNGS